MLIEVVICKLFNEVRINVERKLCMALTLVTRF